MTPVARGKMLLQLGFCLVLVLHMLPWSAAWSAPTSKVGKVEQLADPSPPFLVRTGDSNSGDLPLATCESTVAILAPVGAVLAGRAGTSVTHRIRIASFPVVPQAPPALA